MNVQNPSKARSKRAARRAAKKLWAQPVTGWVPVSLIIDHKDLGKVLVRYKLPIHSVMVEGLRHFKLSNPKSRLEIISMMAHYPPEGIVAIPFYDPDNRISHDYDIPTITTYKGQ